MKHKKELKAGVEVAKMYGAIINESLSAKTSVWLDMDTKHGSVTVSILPAWVHIRLPEPLIPLASAAFHDQPNPFSGKWNIIFDTPEHDELHRRLGWIKDNA